MSKTQRTLTLTSSKSKVDVAEVREVRGKKKEPATVWWTKTEKDQEFFFPSLPPPPSFYLWKDNITNENTTAWMQMKFSKKKERKKEKKGRSDDVGQLSMAWMSGENEYDAWELILSIHYSHGEEEWTSRRNQRSKKDHGRTWWKDQEQEREDPQEDYSEITATNCPSREKGQWKGLIPSPSRPLKHTQIVGMWGYRLPKGTDTLVSDWLSISQPIQTSEEISYMIKVTEIVWTC